MNNTNEMEIKQENNNVNIIPYIKPRFATQIDRSGDYTICKANVNNYDEMMCIYYSIKNICMILNIPTLVNEPRKNFKGVVKRFKEDKDDTYFAKKTARKKALDKAYNHYYKFFNDVNYALKRISCSINDSHNFCKPKE